MDDPDSQCTVEQQFLEYDSNYRAEVNTVTLADIDPSEEWIKAGTPHIVAAPNSNTKRNQLFILFPGSGSPPSAATKLGGVASFVGYHFIGLAYANNGSISDLCRGSQLTDCHATVISERIYGDGNGDISNLVAVSAANSVIGRLKSLLTKLVAQYPNQNWEQYLVADELQWNKVVVSGASQGGKTAAFLSRDIEVNRAVLLSAMGSAEPDEDGNPVVSLWSTEPRKTPANRVYGIWHHGESANAYAPVILDSYGVSAYGGILDVDNVDTPYGCSHMLRTDLEPGAGNPLAVNNNKCDEHRSVGADDCAALDENGNLELTPVYIYMMTHEEVRTP